MNEDLFSQGVYFVKCFFKYTVRAILIETKPQLIRTVQLGLVGLYQI